MSNNKKWSSGYLVVDLGFTKKELDIFEQKTADKTFKDFRSFLNSRVRKLAKENKDIEITNDDNCERCLRKRNKFFIDKDIAPIIIQLAKNNCQPVAEFIRDTCIKPILNSPTQQ